jgi:hypothetical protein
MSSQLPWKIKGQDIYDGNGMFVCSWSGMKANASFIVRACNNHEKLVGALKKIVHSTGKAYELVEIAQQALQSAEKGKRCYY